MPGLRDPGFQISPLVLNLGDVFGPTGFFDIFADLTLAPGIYSGSFTVFDSERQLSVTQDFQITVTAAQTVHEPASMLLLGTALVGPGSLQRKRRRSKAKAIA